MLKIYPVFVSALLAFHLCHAQIPPNIPLGSSITAGSNSSWLSPSADFAFGFFPLSTGLYLVGVWFDKIPDKTLIWSANRDDPADAGSTIRLTYGGQLVLTYNNGSVQPVYTGAAASLGYMQNDGNFVLRDSIASPLWQSFSFPTNTILPGQVLLEGEMLYANQNNTNDYSTGNFMLAMQYDGNLVLSAFRFADPGYWYTGTLMNNVSLIFNQSTALMYLVNGTSNNIFALTNNLSVPVDDYYHRATIDMYGNFQQYIYRRNNGTSWVGIWRAITDPCTVNSVCGIYGLCTSPDNVTVKCDCLPGYIPLDLNDISKGCRPEIMVNYCTEPNDRNFTVELIEDADFPFEGFADLSRVVGVDVEGCKKALMEDCNTVAAALRDTTCNKKRMPLLNAHKSESTKGRTAFIKVPNRSKGSGNPFKVKKKNKTRSRVKIGLLTSSALSFLLGLLAIYYHPVYKKLVQRRFSPDTTSIGINFRKFTYQELREATNGFSNSLGRGSSGKVYKGTIALKDVEIEIAVKKLENVSERTEREFMTELRVIGNTHHKNLVRLLGFCTEAGNRLLVYELMKNGTLSDFLFKPDEVPSWKQRSEMAIGIARGLQYLHEECEIQIIHCDIKPQNVLLDGNNTVKIADFGLSKLLKKDKTITQTGARGTVGYMAPEWLKNVPVTTKVDIYSFGVMLLEICCARRHVEKDREEEESEEEDLILTEWALVCVRSGRLESLVRHDPEVLRDFERFERMVLAGLWCVHWDPFLRPTMKKVVQMLEGVVEVGIPPIVYNQ